MTIFRTKADCQTCHGWAADGRKMDTQMPDAPNLRTTRLGRAGIIYAIKCGRPGRACRRSTGMAYKDAARCNNMTRGRPEEEQPGTDRSGRDAAAARDRDGGRLPVRESDRQGPDGPREVRGVLGVRSRRSARSSNSALSALSELWPWASGVGYGPSPAVQHDPCDCAQSPEPIAKSRRASVSRPSSTRRRTGRSSSRGYRTSPGAGGVRWSAPRRTASVRPRR